MPNYYYMEPVDEADSTELWPKCTYLSLKYTSPRYSFCLSVKKRHSQSAAVSCRIISTAEGWLCSDVRWKSSKGPICTGDSCYPMTLVIKKESHTQATYLQSSQLSRSLQSRITGSKWILSYRACPSFYYGHHTTASPHWSGLHLILSQLKGTSSMSISRPNLLVIMWRLPEKMSKRSSGPMSKEACVHQ